MDRDKYEQQLTRDINREFRARAKSGSVSGLDTAVAAAAQPVLDRVYRDAAMLLVLAWMQDGSFKSSEVFGLVSSKAARQARRLGSGVLAVSEDRLAGGAKPSEVFTRSRASTIAVTEITDAISKAEREATAFVKDKTGQELKAYWVTEKDSKVCPICSPLDGKPEKDWERKFPDGPPAHVNCRCVMRWQ